ncbi:hypothetical protein CHLRE_12g486550v5 [Chlamydomonas reinhardtii]|uniref:Flagellar associated protein n=1 Tax=Chlamydomonas reinhardtii TaxID=3055 RepID=A0A2K3D2F0_CHLRE|nr:uncharacterized protein CHLRE_12g486550v5 [Chlamydomonas reinhardtii]PNW74699.1 hypothetical protein CHLRE_12g486550v5 [Chlamydomonas reinhardtii]
MAKEEDTKRPPDEEEDSDEEDDDDSASIASTASSTASVDSSGAKKKKKKKKKKKGKGGAAGQAAPAGEAAQAASPQTSTLTKAQKQEAERRFTAALDACRGANEMWVKLSNCNIFDVKAKKLADVLKSNSCITSLDLSQNHISDEGAQALAAMLQGSGAPELIELDLRDNPLSPSAVQSLESLQKARKQLVVKVGSAGAGEEGKRSPGKGGEAGGTGTGMKPEVTKGPMFRKYFQSGNDDDDNDSGQGDLDGPLGDGGMAPEDLWAEIKSLVEEGTSSIPTLSLLLQQLIGHLNRELGTLQVPHTDAAVDGSRPHIKGCIMHLDVLAAILDLVPREVTMQYVSEPQPAVGSHRVWATEIVSMLLAPNHQAVDNLVASCKLVPKVLAISLGHPLCSALHTRALRILRSCCVSKVAGLYGPLFTAGMGAGLTVGEGGELCPSLQQQLADRAALAVGVPSGRRDRSVGFVLEACKVLRACCDEANRDSILNTNVRRLLQMDAKWSDFVSEGGVLSQLCKEQEGDLGGPRAARVQMEDSNELAELAGGGLISSHEILALLHGMGALGMSPGSGGN